MFIMRKDVIITTGIIFVVGIIVSLLLYYPGHKNRVKWNADLMETSCQIISHQIEQSRCAEDCHCRDVCDSDGYCQKKCETCYYTCYKGYFTSEYNITEPIESLNTFSIYYRTDRSRINVENSLKANKKILSKFLCYYHQSEPTKVVTSKYHENAFLVTAIIFFVLTFLVGSVGLIGLGLRSSVHIQNYYNNLKNPTYDATSDTISSSSSSSSETSSV